MSTLNWNRKNRLKSRPFQQAELRLNGIAYLFPAYLIWGLSPVYWKWIAHVNSFELLMHRTVWSLLFLCGILFMQRRTRELVLILKRPATLALLSGSTLILALNWYLYIWAVNHDEVLQASLAYYINPLLMVFFGMIFFKERLSRLQVIALVLAGAGVGYYTFSMGAFPWISVVIAVTFGLYGLMHKMMAVLPLPGLCIETLLMSVPALGYLVYLHANGGGALFNIDPSTDLLLIGTCLVTGLPLLFFTIGTKRSTLTTVGFMQYIAPSCTFLLAVMVYKEPFSIEQLTAFALIWIALACYSADSVVRHRRRRRYRPAMKAAS